jgi:hypothetical protein
MSSCSTTTKETEHVLRHEEEEYVRTSTVGSFALVIILAFSMAALQGPPSVVSAAATHDVELIVKVNEKGFFDEHHRAFGARHPLVVPKGKRVTITFVFDEALNSLAIGDTHQIAITADDGSTIESNKFWAFSRKASVSFVAGEHGRKQYRGHCILDCIGMDHLTNLVIRVGEDA